MANFAEELNSVKLRKVTLPKRDYSDPKLAGYVSQYEIEDYQDTVLDCNIELWYEAIKECTFPTVFCTINLNDAKLFVSVYEKNFRNISEIEHIQWRESLNETELEILQSLESRLEEKIQEFEQNSNVFVKTSSRSAKDSPIFTDNFRKLYKLYLKSLTTEEQMVENEQIICLLKAAFQSLKVTNAREVIEMFIKSERIYQDMLLAIEKSPTRFTENFVIRRFYEIEIDMEFRGFVHNGQLTALSQYNYLIHSKRLNEKKEEIKNNIKKYFDELVAKKLKDANFLSSFIIDFAYISSKKLLILLIEVLNSFEI